MTTTTTTMNESTPSTSDRLEAELSLLEAMYPDTIKFDRKSLELTYKTKQPRQLNMQTNANDSTTCGGGGGGAILVLRLPRTYPEGGVPELISACDSNKTDVRETTRRAISELNLQDGIEVLDQILAVFDEVVSSSHDSQVSGPFTKSNRIDSFESLNQQGDNGDDYDVDVNWNEDKKSKVKPPPPPPPSKTVIIWLHHLLATSKRKLALSPSNSNTTADSSNTTTTTTISGMTKPGYPGVMIFSGPRDLVDSHVRELKSLNWQAFQKRHDTDEDEDERGTSSNADATRHKQDVVSTEKDDHDKDDHDKDDGEWIFAHGRNKIIEVESMAGLVKGIVHERHRDIFLRAVGVK